MSGLMVMFGLVVVLAIAVVVVYNLLVKRRQMTNNGWADIDVQLKRRADLIPRLVDVVKGYAAHERALFADIADKRSRALSVGDNPEERAAAESALAAPLSRMIAVAEDYPALKANENFLELQRALAETEDKIEMARRFYNGAVRELNTLVASVPVNFLAVPFGFSKRAYFEIEAPDRSTPTIDVGPTGERRV